MSRGEVLSIIKAESVEDILRQPDPIEKREEYKQEIIKKYGKPIRKIYTDEELEPYSKPLRKLHNKEEVIRKYGK